MNNSNNTASATESHGDAILATVRILMIILAALVSGQIVFAAIVLFAMDVWNQPSKGVLMSALAVGFAIQMFAMALFVPAFAQKAGVKRSSGNVDQLLGVYRTKTIIGAAFVEGGGFLNLVALMLEQNKWSLAPVAAGIVFMVTMIPSETRITNWIEGVRQSPTE